MGTVQCYSCRKWGATGWLVYPDGRREMVAPCCGPFQVEEGWRTEGEAGPAPDVAQWLRTRLVRVAWLIRAARNVPEKGGCLTGPPATPCNSPPNRRTHDER